MLAPELLRDADVGKAVCIALAAELAGLGLDEERARMYFDLVLDSLSKAAQRELLAMDPAKYEYRSEFAKRYFGQGLAEGKAEGKAEGEIHGRVALLHRQLARRFGALPSVALERLAAASADELDAVGERLLTAQSLDDALG